MKKIFLFLLITAVSLVIVNAQFSLKSDKVKSLEFRSSVNQDSGKLVLDDSETTFTAESFNRQMVMDDGYTFFQAKPVKGRNAKNTGDIDVGWYLKPTLRLMGTFPDNSGFRIVVKKNGKELSKFFCSAWIYRKKDDVYMRSAKINGNYDDFMQENKCANETIPIKDLGWMDVEIYYVDGNTNQEKIVRKHKIDVHKAVQIKGTKSAPYPGVSEYFIERYAEASVGILHAGGGNYLYGGSLAAKPFSFDYEKKGGVGRIYMYLSISPDKRTYYKANLRCSVNEQNIALAKDGIDLRRPSTATYFYETALAQRNEPKFIERIEFTYLNAALPLSVGIDDTLTVNISKHPGKWECSILENGETYRIIRFEVSSNGKIVPHLEQLNGNINLYHETYLIDVEIPAGSSIDARSMPMPENGLFYGITWSTSEGKATATKVPKKGNPYPVLPK